MNNKTNTKEKGFEEFIEQELGSLHNISLGPLVCMIKSLCMDTELVLGVYKKYSK